MFNKYLCSIYLLCYCLQFVHLFHLYLTSILIFAISLFMRIQDNKDQNNNKKIFFFFLAEPVKMLAG